MVVISVDILVIAIVDLPLHRQRGVLILIQLGAALQMSTPSISSVPPKKLSRIEEHERGKEERRNDVNASISSVPLSPIITCSRKL